MRRKKLGALARALREHPGAVRADFAEYYGLDIDRMGVDYSALHAAELMSNLPDGARTRIAYDKGAVWTIDRTLAAAETNALHYLLWAQTKDGRKGRNKPKLIGPFERQHVHRKQALAMTVEELEEILSRPRGGIPNG